MTNKIAIIDADSIVYVVGSNLSKQGDISENSIENGIYSFLDTITKKTGSNKYVGFIGKHNTKGMRYDMYADYKANHTAKKEDWYEEYSPVIRKIMVDKFQFQELDWLEADDACSVVAKYCRAMNDKLPSPIIDYVVCSPDKDLKQIPGEHYDYKKSKSEFMLEEDAITCLWRQVFIGDSGDNIKGIPGFGPKSWDKFYDKFGQKPDQFWASVAWRIYTAKLGRDEGVEQFFLNYNLVKLREKPHESVRFDFIDSSSLKCELANNEIDNMHKVGFENVDLESFRDDDFLSELGKASDDDIPFEMDSDGSISFEDILTSDDVRDIAKKKTERINFDPSKVDPKRPPGDIKISLGDVDNLPI